MPQLPLNWRKLIFFSRTTGRHPWKWMLARIAVLVTISLVFMVSCVDSFIFLPPDSPSEPDGRMTMIPLPGDAGKIAAIYRPPAKDGGWVFLCSHGNAEDLFSFYPELPAGSGFLIYDYEGYGASSGTPGEAACYRDIEAAYHYLTNERKIPPERIVIYGFSVGSGPSCYLAEKYPAAALVLVAPFTSAVEVVLPWPELPVDRFRNIDRIGNIRCPVLIFHGDADSTIDSSHGRKLSLKAPNARFVPVPGAGHNTVAGHPVYRSELKKFISSLETP